MTNNTEELIKILHEHGVPIDNVKRYYNFRMGQNSMMGIQASIAGRKAFQDRGSDAVQQKKTDQNVMMQCFVQLQKACAGVHTKDLTWGFDYANGMNPWTTSLNHADVTVPVRFHWGLLCA